MKFLHLPILGPAAVWILAGQLLAPQAFAQWSTSSTTNNPISTVVNRQVLPRVTDDGSGGAIIVWMDDRNSGTNSTDIYAQRISASGVVQWGANGVAVCANRGYQSAPQVTNDGRGGAIVVWQDNRVFSVPAIFAQHITAGGLAEWTPDGVSLGAGTIGQSQAQLIRDGAGGAFVTWKNSTTSVATIQAQRIDSSGALQWAVGGSPVSTSITPELPQIISDGAGGVIIAWNEWEGVYPAGGHDIYAQRINGLGILQWGPRGSAVCSDSAYQTTAHLASDGSNGAVIVWRDSRSAPGTRLYAQRVDAAGAVQWTSNGVSIAPGTMLETDHEVLRDGSGGAYVTWMYGDNTIFAQRINAAGSVQWAPSGVSIGAAGNSRYPQIASDGGTGAIITYYRLSGGSTGADVYAQRINAAGVVQWQSNGVAVSNAASDQQEQHVAADGLGGAILAWTDGRNSTNGLDIYAQRISANGTLGGATGAREDDQAPTSFTLDQNYPNPFNPSTTIRYGLPVKSSVSLTVYNSLGQRVALLMQGEKEAGSHDARFDGAGLPSGTYFYRLRAGGIDVTRRMLLVK